MSILMQKANSENIIVFPAGFRSQQYNKSKFTTEDNLITFAQLSSNPENNNQVFTDPYDSSRVIIYLKGYYFNLPKDYEAGGVPIPASGKPLYAFIRLFNKDHNVGYVLGNISANDGSSYEDKFLLDSTFAEFNGLGFCESLDDIKDLENVYYVKIKDSANTLLTQKLKLDSTEIRSNSVDGAETSIDEVFGSELIKAKRISARSTNPLQIDNKIVAKDALGTSYEVEISGKLQVEANVDIDVPFNVGSDQASGTVSLSSAGNSQTKIVGPNGGQINLPANAPSNDMVFIQTNGASTWLGYSKLASAADTLVQRDGTDIKSNTFNTIQINTGVEFNTITLQSNNNVFSLLGKLNVNGQLSISGNGITIKDSAAQHYIDVGNSNQYAVKIGSKGTGIQIGNNGSMSIDAGVTINSDVTIEENSPLSAYAPIIIGDDTGVNTGSITIRSGGTDSTKIIGPNNGQSILPNSSILNPDSKNYIWAQKRNVGGIYHNTWLATTAIEGVANALVLTDGNGNLNIKNSGVSEKANNFLIDSDATNSSFPILFSPSSTSNSYISAKYNTNVKINPATGNVSANRFNNLALTALTSGFKINGGITERQLIVDGSATIKTTEGAAANIILTSGTTLNLPGNSPQAKRVFAQQSAGTPVWIPYDTEPNPDALVLRDSSGGISAMNISVRSLSGTPTDRAAYITAGGELKSVSLYSVSSSVTADTLTSSDGAYAFVTDVNQSATGKITVKKGYLPIANTSAAGAIKVMKTYSSARIKQTSPNNNVIANRYYGLETDPSGHGFVYVPWVNSTYTGTNGISVVNDAISHTNSINEKTVASQTDKTLKWGNSFNVYEPKYDAQGHITGTFSAKMTLPDNPNTAHIHTSLEDSPIQHYGEGSTSGEVYFNLKTIDRVAGTYGHGASETINYGDTFDVPNITVDKYGRVTAASVSKLTLPNVTTAANDKVTQNKLATDKTESYPLLLSNYTANVGNTTAAAVNRIDDLYYIPSLQTLYANKFNGDGSQITKLNASNIKSGTLDADRLPTIPGLSEGTYGSSAGQLYHGDWFVIPQITVDKTGRITNVSSQTITLPGSSISYQLSSYNRTGSSSYSRDYAITFMTTDTATMSTSVGSMKTGYGAFTKDVTINPANGQLKAVSYLATSDARRKENISEFIYEKSVLDLPVKRFDFKDGAKHQIGCLAQDLQKLYPELVTETSDGYLAIQENKLVYLLLEEVKLLRDRVANLEKE